MDYEDNSDDVVAIEPVINENIADVSTERRPIMLLFQRLISNDNKQNTILTNSQIIDILQKEFDLKMHQLHELEVDIYLTVTKKFLKDWPQWDDFENVVQELKSAGAYASLYMTLEKKYLNLKEYLGVMIDATRKISKTPTEQITKQDLKENGTGKDNILDTNDVVLEVNCTRSQLNNLIIRYPNSEFNYSVFNVVDPSTSRIKLKTYSIESILNWWSIKIKMDLNCLALKLENFHDFKHMLVNKQRNDSSKKDIGLNQDIEFKINKRTRECNKMLIISILDKIHLLFKDNIQIYCFLQIVFNFIKENLSDLPKDINIPATYRKHPCKYKYKRYLNADNISGTNVGRDEKYDLQLEETVSPIYQINVTKVENMKIGLPPFSEWFSIECFMCRETFSGDDLMVNLKDHFSEYHHNEPDWTCTNCGVQFSMAELTEKRWNHDC